MSIFSSRVFARGASAFFECNHGVLRLHVERKHQQKEAQQNLHRGEVELGGRRENVSERDKSSTSLERSGLNSIRTKFQERAFDSNAQRFR